MLLGPFRLVFWAGMVPLLPVLGARMAGLDAGWVAVVQLVPTILLIVAAFLLIDIALSETVPGAYDNASGVAAVLGAARRLRDDPPANLDVWVVLTGAEESLAEGMRSWARRHARELDRERTLIVNVEGASYGTVHYRVSEGAVISYAMDPELIELCEALAAAEPDEGSPPPPPPLGGGLRRPRRARAPDAVHLAGRRRRRTAPAMAARPRGHPRARGPGCAGAHDGLPRLARGPARPRGGAGAGEAPAAAEPLAAREAEA